MDTLVFEIYLGNVKHIKVFQSYTNFIHKSYSVVLKTEFKFTLGFHNVVYLFIRILRFNF